MAWKVKAGIGIDYSPHGRNASACDGREFCRQTTCSERLEHTKRCQELRTTQGLPVAVSLSNHHLETSSIYVGKQKKMQISQAIWSPKGKRTELGSG
jgi:hypothetical protein